MNENSALLPVRLKQTVSLSSSLPFTKVVFQFLMHSCFIFNLIVEFSYSPAPLTFLFCAVWVDLLRVPYQFRSG